MRFGVFDKATANLLWHGECACDSYENQKQTDGQVVVPIKDIPDMRRLYQLNEFNELEDIGLSEYGKAMEQHNAIHARTT